MSLASLSQAKPIHSHEAETQKLVRCEMRHPNGHISVRFTSLEVFLLWAHMMRTRHNMECRDYAISLWIPADEFENKSRVFAHSGNIEQVNRFDFSLFDTTYNYAYRATRFVLASDSERFKEAMSSHLPRELQANDRFTMEKVPGYCIEKEKATQDNQLVLGLVSGLNDIY